MKYSAISTYFTIISVFLASAGTTYAQPPNSDGGSSPQEILESPTCKSFVKKIERKMSELLEYDDNTVVEHACNPIERENIVSAIGEMEKNVNNPAKEPCLQAFEMLLLEEKYDIMDTFITEESCTDQLHTELTTLREVNSGSGRALLRGQAKQQLARLLQDGGWILELGIAAAVTVGVIVFVGVIILSDERLKENIVQVGTSPSGIPTYTFTYRSDLYDLVNNMAVDVDVDVTSTYYGVMAQDLLKLAPDAVVENPNGYYTVDYSKIDVDFHKVD